MTSTVYKNQNKFLKLFVDDAHYDINEYLFAHYNGTNWSIIIKGYHLGVRIILGAIQSCSPVGKKPKRLVTHAHPCPNPCP